MPLAEKIEFQLLLAKLTPQGRQLVKTVLTAALNAKPSTVARIAPIGRR